MEKAEWYFGPLKLQSTSRDTCQANKMENTED